MSVLDNVRVGGHRRRRGNFFSDVLRLPSAVRRDAVLTDAAWEVLDYFNLRAVAATSVAELPFGLQKRVELAARWPPRFAAPKAPLAMTVGAAFLPGTHTRSR